MLAAIKRTYGVDLEELLQEHRAELMAGRDDDCDDVLQALATGAHHSDIAGCYTLIRLAWAVGRKSGKAEPDLSVFEDALRDGGAP